MGSLPPPVKLTLDVRPAFVPNTIGGFLREVASIDDVSRRSSRLEDLVSNLEEELRKIDAFKRELPLCMLLMQDAIITLKLELVQCKAARSDYQPMQLAELMPLKKGSDEVEIERHDEDDKEKDAKDKKNWKSCLQLWNSSTSFNNNDSPTAARSFDLKEDRKAESTKGNDELEKNQEAASEKDDVLRKNRNRVSEFIPIFPRKETEEELELPLSLLTSSGGSKKSCSSSMEKTEKRPSSSSSIRRPISLNFQPSSRNSGEQQQNSRKLRRCWSPELHRRFISALQQLGGSQVATPKQIRELMQVDGLTNDEVKSHLQKYRLHTRRYPVASAANETKKQSNQSQFVLRGLWPSSSQDKTDESAKANNNNNNDLSGSPEGPLQLCLSAGAAASATGGGDSNSMEDDEDSKSRRLTWGKNHIHRPSTIGV